MEQASKEAYRGSPDSGEHGSAIREPCWSGENRLCGRIARTGRSGMPASVWRSRSRLGFQPTVGWEQRPTGSSATATRGPVSTPAPCMRNELLPGQSEPACVLEKAELLRTANTCAAAGWRSGSRPAV